MNKKNSIKTMTIPDDWVSITQASIMLKLPYQRARNLALQGRFGEIRYNRSRRYFIDPAAVRAFARAEEV